MKHRNLLVFGSLTVVVLLVTAGAPAALNDPTGALDPCALTEGATGLANRVCLDGATITVAEGWVGDVASGAHAGVTFVTFHVATATPTGAPPLPGVEAGMTSDPRVVISRDAATWSAHLPGAQELHVRLAGDLEPGMLDGATWGEDPYRIVRLATPLLPEWVEALDDVAARPLAYLPVNHFLVQLFAPEAEAALHALSFVRDSTPVAAAAKVEPGLIAAGGEPLLHVLTMPTPGALSQVEADAEGLGAALHSRVDALDRLTLRLSAEDIPLLAAHPGVLWIGQTSEVAETDMDIIRARVGADAVQTAPLGYDGTGVVGQVMDSGLQTTHPDFQASLLEVDGSNTVATHGTSVYGIVFGDGTGNPSAVGMAPGAQGTFAWYNSGMSRYTHAENLADRWDGVFQTHSWGRGIPKDNTYDSHSVEMDRIAAELDVLGLQSMSNCGPGCARREAMAKNILSIGALYHQDNPSLSHDFWWGGGSRASTGPAADGRIKPELVGPYDRILTTTVNGYTTGFGGTSGATPVNAGAVAIVHHMVSDDLFGAHPTGVASPAAAKAILIASAHTYAPDQVDHPTNIYTDYAPQWLIEPYKRDIQGWGVAQLDRLAAAGSAVLLVDQTASLATGDTWSIDYQVPAGAARVHITLAWTDPPATPSATFALVNDLDLRVDGILGLVPFFGNFGLNQGTTSLPGGIPDRLNNVENVILPVAGGETIPIHVMAAAVNQDADPNTPGPTQRFALAVVPVFDA